LALIYCADYAFDYEGYPQLRSHFPVWNIRGLYFVGIALTAVSVVGFLVDHKSWRVGFFVLAFLLLVFLVPLATFTGFAYRNTRQTYEYYKGTATGIDTCRERMYLAHSRDLQRYGCPQKYLNTDECIATTAITPWEGTALDTSPPVVVVVNAGQTGTILNTPIPPASLFLVGDNNIAGTGTYTCVNTRCCGLLGQMYSQHLIQLAACGLMATLAAALVSIGCYYFWYVTWVDTARDKRRDFVWLGLMALFVLVFVILFFAVDRTYIIEKLGADSRHLSTW